MMPFMVCDDYRNDDSLGISFIGRSYMDNYGDFDADVYIKDYLVYLWQPTVSGWWLQKRLLGESFRAHGVISCGAQPQLHLVIKL